MKQESSIMQRAIVAGIFIALTGLVMAGTVAAGDDDMMDNCRQVAAGNGTTGYWPGMMGAGGYQMMESVEISAMGGPMHDEMQDLVTKMMAGNLSSSDQARMVEIMNRYPGASNMMVTRMTGGNGQGSWNGYPGMMGTGGAYSGAGMMGGYGLAGGAGMMNSGFMWLGAILAFLFYVVWLAVGILAILWFMKQLGKDTPPS